MNGGQQRSETVLICFSTLDIEQPNSKYQLFLLRDHSCLTDRM